MIGVLAPKMERGELQVFCRTAWIARVGTTKAFIREQEWCGTFSTSAM